MVFGFILVLMGEAIIGIVMGMANSEPHSLSGIAGKLWFAAFLIFGVGVTYCGYRVMRVREKGDR